MHEELGGPGAVMKACPKTETFQKFQQVKRLSKESKQFD